jgi:hypothetical protein
LEVSNPDRNHSANRKVIFVSHSGWLAAERKRSAMRRRGLRIATETRPAHSLQQKFGGTVIITHAPSLNLENTR